VTLGGINLGASDAAFKRLNREVLMIIGRPGHPLMKEIAAVIDADDRCSHEDVARAVAACAGRIDDQTGQRARYIEKIIYSVPHLPKPPE